MASGFKRIGGYVANVGFFRGLGLVIYRGLGRILCPGANLTWGGLGEDALLWFYLYEVLGLRREGFYVDVGCNHPIRHSNTYRLYQLGWRGIAIDADTEMTSTYQRLRPRDDVVTSLVSDTAHEMTFYVFEESLVSTVDVQQAESWIAAGRKVRETRTLTARTLDSILDELGAPRNFELLKVDVEGHDAAVLRSIDLAKYRPRMILVEMHNESIENVAMNDIYRQLSDHNYRMVSLAGYNGIFIRQGD